MEERMKFDTGLEKEVRAIIQQRKEDTRAFEALGSR